MRINKTQKTIGLIIIAAILLYGGVTVLNAPTPNVHTIRLRNFEPDYQTCDVILQTTSGQQTLENIDCTQDIPAVTTPSGWLNVIIEHSQLGILTGGVEGEIYGGCTFTTGSCGTKFRELEGDLDFQELFWYPENDLTRCASSLNTLGYSLSDRGFPGQEDKRIYSILSLTPNAFTGLIKGNDAGAAEGYFAADGVQALQGAGTTCTGPYMRPTVSGEQLSYLIEETHGYFTIQATGGYNWVLQQTPQDIKYKVKVTSDNLFEGVTQPTTTSTTQGATTTQGTTTTTNQATTTTTPDGEPTQGNILQFFIDWINDIIHSILGIFGL